MRILVMMLACSVAASGCASITTGTSQTIEVESKSGDGATTMQMQCELQNDKGQWSLAAPGSIQVARSSKDLMVRCTTASGGSGTATAVSRANAGMLGNVLVSCGLGMPIDHFTGARYDYPSPIVVWLGKETRIDKHVQ